MNIPSPSGPGPDPAETGWPSTISFRPEDLEIGDEPRTGTANGQHDDELLRLLAHWGMNQRNWMIGFPVNLDFDYRPLADFLAVSLNNVGTAYAAAGYNISTRPFERQVLEFFIRLTGGQVDQVAGYTTSGGTESNIFGVHLGMRRYPDAVFYTSADAHYSVDKITSLFDLDQVKIDTGDDGAMDLDALTDACLRRRDRPAVVLATVGTTMTGAADDVAAVRPRLAAAGVHRVHLHVDAAFSGLIVPFIPGYGPWAFDAGADSLAISGHKVIGLPVPAGIALARREHLHRVGSHVTQVDADDYTLTGSRDGLAPLMLWWALRRLGRDGLERRARHCLHIAEYAEQRLRECGADPRRVPHSIIVGFQRPADDVLETWHLLDAGEQSHLIAMPHLTEEHIDRLCQHLRP
ncbi:MULTISPECIES: histidine decarboxylase [Actinomadura]|uniref:Histidine decarboxylase n=1 Tax=Actinomadura yumaensis TaxID=111807 RepID=A0ABW2CF96_9ACTN|nr:histidine decarboxylase [Actinomadura sp. J1-007]MWK38417.1 histidine decarboxylase [Actinomadura sp. J1-007]